MKYKYKYAGWAIVWIIFGLISNTLLGQNNNRFEKQVFKNQKGDSLNYRMLFPDYAGKQKYPLVIFLHGSGERGKDNEAQLKWGAMAFATDQMMAQHPAIVIAPQCPENSWWSNTIGLDTPGKIILHQQPSKPMELVFDLIEQLTKKMPIDTNRIYITGLSMGGYGTYDAIMRKPKLFAAALPVCGAGDISKAASIAHIPIWILHGADDPAVPVAHTYAMANALTQNGAMPGLTIYPGVGHFSWIAAYNDLMVMEWLFKQHK